MFCCWENQKEKFHLLHKETNENLNDLNPITSTKVQNSTPILLLKPNPVILSKTTNPLANIDGFPSTK